METSDEVKSEIEIRLDSIENQLKKIFWFIEFHLGEIPQKYKKIFPKEGEYPYFRKKPNYPSVHAGRCGNTIIPCEELEMPKDPQEYKKAKERIHEYLKEKDKIEEVYYELSEINMEDEFKNWKHMGETLSKEEAEKWAGEGGIVNYKIHGQLFSRAKRMIKSKTRRVVKLKSLEPYPVTLASEDLHQVDKQTESFPS